MCGILGLVGNGSPVDREWLLQARDTMSYRGPDDSGYLEDEGVVLAHRRLSIIDLEGGHQPMSVADGKVWIVFNGEIYNFPELRRWLKSRGHRFSSSSDTEVILRLYLESGPKSFERLNGIFAFAIWDRRSKEVHLVRDQMGVKPLYYASTPQGLVFASEVKVLLATGLVEPELEEAALPEFMVFRDVSGPRTLFRGVQRLLPGHHLRVAEGRTEVREYWSLKPEGTQFTGSYADAVDTLETRLSEAVRRQMISDVPLGTFCSGGVDSSLVTAFAAQHSERAVDTFSVGFEEAQFDETRYARMVAARWGTRHHELRMSGREFAADLERMIWHNDEPLHFPNSVQIHAVSKLARGYVTVVLTGEGADELFGGYPRYQIPLMLRRWRRLPQKLRSLLVAVADRFGEHRLGKLESFHQFPGDLLLLMNAAVAESGVFDTESMDGEAVSEFRRSALALSGNGADPLTRLCLLDQQTYLVSILNRQDKMSMATSIESRVPFLDVDLVRFANSLPPEFKVGRFENKRVLKTLALRHLPSEVVTRRKSGFGVPLSSWFRDDKALGGLVQAHYDSEIAMLVTGGRSLQQLHQDHREGRSDNSDLLWAALNLALWKRAFDVGVSLNPVL